MFIYSFPVLLAEHALDLSAWLLFAALLVGFFYLSAPVAEYQPVKHQRKVSFYQFLWSSWQGLEPLLWVFWPFFVLINVWIYLSDHAVLNADISVSSWINLHLIMLMPIIWWTGSVWRASASHGSRLWIAVARLGVSLAYLEYGAKIYIFIQMPRAFFQCDEAVLNYFSCF
ncbi:MAG: hypothetical protein RQ715_05430 [Methylococcales bacterium]|nr:hypothetical protein [Methylococcales bacterium]